MIKNTKLFSPIVYDGPCTFPVNTFAWKQWWKEERRRCLEGYEVNGIRITGDYYFYLNYWKILGRNPDPKIRKKTLISPRFTELDFEFFNEVEKAKKAGKHLCVAKRRQCGFSEKAASLAGKEFCFFPHSQTIIIAGESKYSDDTMRKVHRGINALKWSEFRKRMSPSAIDMAIARYKNPGDRDWRGYFSELHSMTAKDNDQVTVGKTPSLIIFEEAGKFKNLIGAFNYIKPAFEANGEVTSFALVFGTGGEMDTGADQLMHMFYNPSTYNMMEYEDIYSEDYDPQQTDRKKVGFFVPAWKFMIIDEDGNNLKEESLAKINKDRETAKSSNKSDDFFNSLTQFPIFTEECFLISEGKVFNSAKLNTRLSQIKKSKELSSVGRRGNLNWVKKEKDPRGDVVWVDSEDGKFIRFEEPHKDVLGNIPVGLYKAGTDSYDRDKTAGEGSQGSVSIMKSFINSSVTSRKYVARLTYRPDTADEFYEESAKLCMYYGCRNLIEYSNLLIFTWYKNHGFEWMLKERPEIAYSNVKDSRVQNKYGVDPQTKHEWITRLRDYIEVNCDNLDDEEQIVAFLKFRLDKDYNCDITISSALALVHMEDDIDIEVKELTKPKQNFNFGYKLINNKFVKVYK